MALLLLCAAVLLRAPHFGDPAYMIDEQFYLLVGDRMLHGALPFVDIWDRKPVGLFLIYAAIRLLGGDGILQYQLVATLFATATAWAIFMIARRIALPFGAAAAAILYLVTLEMTEGGGGQAPVFYNLFTALAALMTLRAGAAHEARSFIRYGLIAMAFVGIAIQIKYTVVFEGLFFGIMLACWSIRRCTTWAGAAGATAAFAATALAPTLVALVAYAAIGQGEAFWFANFSSIFLRGGTDPSVIAYRLHLSALRLVPLLLCVAASIFLAWRDKGDAARWQFWFILGWLVAAFAGFVSVGTFYKHYMLPLFVPLTIAAALAFGRGPAGRVLGILIVALGLATLNWHSADVTRTSKAQIAALVRLIPADVDRRCMLVFDGPVILYHLSNACLPTRFPFPDHLSAMNEAKAIGVDPSTELRRVLQHHPRAIVLSRQWVRDPNMATWNILLTALKRDYRLAGSLPFEERRIQIYVSKH